MNEHLQRAMKLAEVDFNNCKKYVPPQLKKTPGFHIERYQLKIGMRFGHWTTTGKSFAKCTGADSRISAHVPCRCDCGHEQPINYHALLSGKSWRCRSCAIKGVAEAIKKGNSRA